MNQSAPVIQITGVSLRYGDTLALDDLSLAIPANRMVGLIGPDGVGKSTTMKMRFAAAQRRRSQIVRPDSRCP